MKKVVFNICLIIVLFLPIQVSAEEKSTMLGLRTVIYEAKDLDKAIEWYTEVFGIKPYVNTSEYVGFNIRGFELGLMPKHQRSIEGNNVLSYWRVTDIDAEYQRVISLGAKPNTPIIPVGGGIRLGTVIDPFGNALRLIYNPLFELDQ